jgi:hypothetical protein
LTLPDEAGTVLTSASDISQQAAGTAVAFSTTATSGQSISPATATIVQYGNELLDTHGYYNPSTYRFTPAVAGWYWLSASTRIDTDVDSEIYDIWLRINGSAVSTNSANQYRYTSNRVSNLVYFNGTTDYADVVVYINISCSLRTNSNENTFSGFLVRAA